MYIFTLFVGTARTWMAGRIRLRGNIQLHLQAKACVNCDLPVRLSLWLGAEQHVSRGAAGRRHERAAGRELVLACAVFRVQRAAIATRERVRVRARTFLLCERVCVWWRHRGAAACAPGPTNARVRTGPIIGQRSSATRRAHPLAEPRPSHSPHPCQLHAHCQVCSLSANSWASASRLLVQLLHAILIN